MADINDLIQTAFPSNSLESQALLHLAEFLVIMGETQAYSAAWKDAATYAHDGCTAELGRSVTDKELLKLAQNSSCLKVTKAGTRDCRVALDIQRLQVSAARADTSGWSTVAAGGGGAAASTDPTAAVAALSAHDAVTVALCASCMIAWPKRDVEETCMRHVAMSNVTAPQGVWLKYGQYKGTVWALTVPCVQVREWFHGRPRPARVDIDSNINFCTNLMQKHAGSFSRPYFTFFRLTAGKGPAKEGQHIAQLQVEILIEDMAARATASPTSLSDMASTLCAVMERDKAGLLDQAKPFIAKLKPIARSPAALGELLKRAQKELPKVHVVKTGSRHNIDPPSSSKAVGARNNGRNNGRSGNGTPEYDDPYGDDYGASYGGDGGGGSAAVWDEDDDDGNFGLWDEDLEAVAVSPGDDVAPAGRWDGDEGQLAALYLAACSAYPPDSKSAKTGVQLCALVVLLGSPARKGHTPHSALLSALVRPCKQVLKVLEDTHGLEPSDLEVADILREHPLIHVPKHTKDPIVQLRLPELSAVACAAAAGAAARPPVTTPLAWPPRTSLRRGVVDVMPEASRSLVERALAADLDAELAAALEVLRATARDANPDVVRASLTALGAVRLTMHSAVLNPAAAKAAAAAAARAPRRPGSSASGAAAGTTAAHHRHAASNLSSVSAVSGPVRGDAPAAGTTPRGGNTAAAATGPAAIVSGPAPPHPSAPPTPAPREPDTGSRAPATPAATAAAVAPATAAPAAATAAAGHGAVRPPPGFGPSSLSPRPSISPRTSMSGPGGLAAPPGFPPATAANSINSSAAPPGVGAPGAPAAAAAAATAGSSASLQISDDELADAVGQYLESQAGAAAGQVPTSEAELLAKVKALVIQGKLRKQMGLTGSNTTSAGSGNSVAAQPPPASPGTTQRPSQLSATAQLQHLMPPSHSPHAPQPQQPLNPMHFPAPNTFQPAGTGGPMHPQLPPQAHAPFLMPGMQQPGAGMGPQAVPGHMGQPMFTMGPGGVMVPVAMPQQFQPGGMQPGAMQHAMALQAVQQPNGQVVYVPVTSGAMPQALQMMPGPHMQLQQPQQLPVTSGAMPTTATGTVAPPRPLVSFSTPHQAVTGPHQPLGPGAMGNLPLPHLTQPQPLVAHPSAQPQAQATAGGLPHWMVQAGAGSLPARTTAVGVAPPPAGVPGAPQVSQAAAVPGGARAATPGGAGGSGASGQGADEVDELMALCTGG